MKQLCAYLWPLKWPVLGVLLLSLLHIGGALTVPTLTASIINEGVLKGNLDIIETYSFYMVGASLITVIAAITSVYASSHIAARISLVMREQLVAALQKFSLTDFSHFGTGTILMRSTRDVEKIQSVLSEGLNMVLPTPLMIFVGLGLTFYKDYYLGLIILTLMIIMTVLMLVIQQRALPIVKSVQIKLDEITDLVRDHILGMPVIRAFNRSHDKNAREVESFSTMASLNIKLHRTYAVGLPSILMIFNMSTVVILWVGGYSVVDGRIQVGDIIAVIEYATQILLALIMSIFVLLDIPEAIICYQRIQELLHHHGATRNESYAKEANANMPGTTDTDVIANAADTASTSDGATITRPIVTSSSLTYDAPLLEFQHVTFRYDNAEAPALEDISFTVHHSQHIAIMGDIGSGKSTIANLIPGLFDIESGDILLNGISIYKQPIEQVRAQIGYVPQKAYLFTGTIDMNLRYGVYGTNLPDITKADTARACAISRADEFIGKFEDGYEHQLSQGGTNLSGGQRQRLAMARALLRNSSLFIFDDSFSALDGTTERYVRQAIAEEMQHGARPALISVEQKVSAAKKADAILVINQGKAVGFGTHEELLDRCDIYKQIVASQEVEA